MVRNLSLLTAGILAATTSLNAATIYIPGSTGIPDQQGNPNVTNGCITNVPTGTMVVGVYGPNPNCLVSYPINLPVGATIDTIEVTYRNTYNGGHQSTIAAYLAKHQFIPTEQNTTVVAGTNTVFGGQSPWLQHLSMLPAGVPSLGVFVQGGATFWVQIPTSYIAEIDYLTLAYH